MTEEINWQKELLESEKFNDKFSKNLLEHGAKNFMQEIYLGYMYSRWRKIRAENLNGRFALVGLVALVGAYITTGQIVPGII